MPNRKIDVVRSVYPKFKDIPDDELTVMYAEQFPSYLEDAEFKADYDRITGKSQIVEAPLEKPGILTGLGRGAAAGGIGMLRDFKSGAETVAWLIGDEKGGRRIEKEVAELTKLQEEQAALSGGGLPSKIGAGAVSIIPTIATGLLTRNPAAAAEVYASGTGAVAATGARAALTDFAKRRIAQATTPAMLGMESVAGTQSALGTNYEAKRAYLEQNMEKVARGEMTLEEAEQDARLRAIPVAIQSGLQTGVITGLFGFSGVEAVGGRQVLAQGTREAAEVAARRATAAGATAEGIKLSGQVAANRFAAVEQAKALLASSIPQTFIRGATAEGLEEGIDQLSQVVLRKLTFNPELTLKQAVDEVIDAVVVGGILGGPVQVGARQLFKGQAEKVVEQDKLYKQAVDQAETASKVAAIRQELRQEDEERANLGLPPLDRTTQEQLADIQAVQQEVYDAEDALTKQLKEEFKVKKAAEREAKIVSDQEKANSRLEFFRDAETKASGGVTASDIFAIQKEEESKAKTAVELAQVPEGGGLPVKSPSIDIRAAEVASTRLAEAAGKSVAVTTPSLVTSKGNSPSLVALAQTHARVIFTSTSESDTKAAWDALNRFPESVRNEAYNNAQREVVGVKPEEKTERPSVGIKSEAEVVAEPVSFVDKGPSLTPVTEEVTEQSEGVTALQSRMDSVLGVHSAPTPAQSTPLRTAEEIRIERLKADVASAPDAISLVRAKRRLKEVTAQGKTKRYASSEAGATTEADTLENPAEVVREVTNRILRMFGLKVLPKNLKVVYQPESKFAGYYQSGEIIINAAQIVDVEAVVIEEALHAVWLDPELQAAWDKVKDTVTIQDIDEQRLRSAADGRYPDNAELREEAAVAKLVRYRTPAVKGFLISIRRAIAKAFGFYVRFSHIELIQKAAISKLTADSEAAAQGGGARYAAAETGAASLTPAEFAANSELLDKFHKILTAKGVEIPKHNVAVWFASVGGSKINDLSGISLELYRSGRQMIDWLAKNGADKADIDAMLAIEAKRADALAAKYAAEREQNQRRRNEEADAAEAKLEERLKSIRDESHPIREYKEESTGKPYFRVIGFGPYFWTRVEAVAYRDRVQPIKTNPSKPTPTAETGAKGKPRYAAAERDADSRYLELAKDPEKNLSVLQGMVDEAAKAAGLVVGFHGTPREARLLPKEFKTTGGATLGPGAYFSYYKTQGDRYDFRGNAQKYFLDVDLPGFADFNKGLTLEEISSGKTTPTHGTGKNGAWIVQNGEVEFVVRDPSQIKSADPITRDESGNVIPPSQRFNTKSEDTRYAAAQRPNPKLVGGKIVMVGKKKSGLFPAVKLRGKGDDSRPKITIEPSNREGFQNLYDSIDFVLETNNDVANSLSANGWLESMAGMLNRSTAIIPPNPERLATWAKNNGEFKEFFNKAYKTDEGLKLIQSAVDGLNSLRPTHEVAMRGGITPQMTSLHMFWGLLSRMQTPTNQEAGWARMTSNKEVLRKIAASIKGEYVETNNSREAWVALTKDVMARVEGSENSTVGRSAIANIHAFHDMLVKWNGKWEKLNSIVNNPNLTGPQMRRQFFLNGFSGGGIKNKVLSFVLATLARNDVFVGDRWQVVNMWFEHLEAAASNRAAVGSDNSVIKTIKGGVPQDTTGAYDAIGGLLIENSTAEAAYALIERGLRKVANDSDWLMPILGRKAEPFDIHWITWNIIKNEAVGHTTLDATFDALKKGELSGERFVQSFSEKEKTVTGKGKDGQEQKFRFGGTPANATVRSQDSGADVEGVPSGLVRAGGKQYAASQRGVGSRLGILSGNTGGVDYLNWADRLRTNFVTKFSDITKMERVLRESAGMGVAEFGMERWFERLAGVSGIAKASIIEMRAELDPLVAGDEKAFNEYIFWQYVERRSSLRAQALADIASAQAKVAAGIATAADKDSIVSNRKLVGEMEFEGYNNNSVAVRQLARLRARMTSNGTLANMDSAVGVYTKHTNKALDGVVSSGYLDQGTVDAYRAQFPVYIPIINLQIPDSKNGYQVAKGRRGISDPNFKMKSPLDAFDEYIFRMHVKAETNKAKRRIHNLAVKSNRPDIARVENVETGTYYSSESYFHVRINGVDTVVVAHPQVVAAVNSFSETASNALTDILQKGNATLKFGATSASLAFQVRNLFFGDLPTLALMSKAGISNPKDVITFVIDVVTSFGHNYNASFRGKYSPLMLEFMKSGAMGSSMHSAIDSLSRDPATGVSSERGIFKYIIDSFGKVSNTIEQTSKLAGFKRLMDKAGVDKLSDLNDPIKQMALVAEVRNYCGSPDFARNGSLMGVAMVRMGTVFLNPAMAGNVSALERLTANLNKNASKSEKAAALVAQVRLGFAVGLATMISYALRTQDDEAEEAYERLTKRSREDNFQLITDEYDTDMDGNKVRRFLQIPKRGAMKIVANTIEAFMDFSRQNDPEGFQTMIGRILEEVVPLDIKGDTMEEKLMGAMSSVNPAIRVPVEYATGMSFYARRPTVARSMQGAAKGEQYNERTNENVKMLAGIFGESPLKMRQAMESLTGGLSRTLLPDKESGLNLDSPVSVPLVKQLYAPTYREPEDKEYMRELKMEADTESVRRVREANAYMKSVEGMTIPEAYQKAVAAYGRTQPQLLARIRELLIQKRAGATREDLQIASLPNRQRAQIVMKRLDAMPQVERLEAAKVLYRKRVITDATLYEMRKMGFSTN